MRLQHAIRSLAANARSRLRSRGRKIGFDTLESRALLAVLTFQEGLDVGVGPYFGTQDTELAGARPNVDAGNQQTVSVDASDGGQPTMALLRFDNIIGANLGQIPIGARIAKATLYFTTTSVGHGGTFHRMLADWTEADTWNTFASGIPPRNTTGGVQPDNLEASSIFNAQIGDPLNINGPEFVNADGRGVDVTRDLQFWAENPSLNKGWAILPLPGGTNGWDWVTSEGANQAERPRLVVDFAPPTASVAVFRQGLSGYAGTVDTTLLENQPDQDSSAVEQLRIQAASTGQTNTNQSLLRFDQIFGNGAGQIPLGSNILSATLRLRTNDPGDGAFLNRMLIPWTDAATWNSTGSGVGGFNAIPGIQADGIEAIATAASIAGNPVTREPNVFNSDSLFDVTEDLRAWAAGAPNYGWSFLPFISGTDAWIFRSAEAVDASTRPELTIYFNADTAAPAEVVVSPTSGLQTTEAGGTAQFTVVLNSAPAADVFIAVTSSDTTEGLPSVSQLIFTPNNWNIPQTVTVTGVDDALIDGNVAYSIIMSNTVSADLNWLGVNVPNVSLRNLDNDTTGLAEFQFQEGVDTGFGVYFGTEDTTLLEDFPDESRGNSRVVGVDFADADPLNSEHGLLRFNNIFGNAPGQIPLGALIVSAKLVVSTTDTGDGARLHRMLQNWDEAATWNSFGYGIQTDGVIARFQRTAQVGIETLNMDPVAGERTSIDVTTDLQAWASGEANYGWAMLPWIQGTNGWEFASSEATLPEVRPRLVVQWLPAGTPNISFQQGVNGYSGTVDTQVVESQPNTSFGFAGELFVDLVTDAGGQAQSLLRFDNIFGNGANQIPTGARILAANLKLNTFDDGDGATFHRMLTPFTNNITWASASSGSGGFNPLGGIQADDTEARSIFRSQAGFASLAPNVTAADFLFDVTADLQAWASGEANHGWALLPWPGGASGWGFYSSEGEDPFTRPQLRVFYELVATQQVTSITTTPTGFIARFNQPIDPAPINLYDDSVSALGAPDVVLLDPSANPVRGSLVIAPDRRSITFIKTPFPASANLLAPGTYTLTLRSGAQAFKNDSGEFLDGDANNIAGGDFVTTFTISTPAANAVVVSVPDIVRGRSQAVNLPESAAGFPVRLSQGSGLTFVQLDLAYSTSLMTITGATLGSTVPAGWTVSLDTTTTPGIARVIAQANGNPALPAGALEIVRLTAAVPADAPYGRKQVLDLRSIQLLAGATTVPAVDDDAIHVAAYPGDTNGSLTLSAADVTALRRVITGLEPGFGAYQTADPRIIGDFNLDSNHSAVDVTDLRRRLTGLSTGIPAPGPSGGTLVGPDPLLSLPRNIIARPGQTVSMPVQLEITDPAGIELENFDIAIAFDPNRFTLSNPRIGSLLTDRGVQFDFAYSVIDGVLRLTANSLDSSAAPLAYGAKGDLILMDLTVKPRALPGSFALNLLADAGVMTTNLSNRQGVPFALVPAPTNSPNDSVDGRVLIRTRVEQPIKRAPNLSATSGRVLPRTPGLIKSSKLSGGNAFSGGKGWSSLADWVRSRGRQIRQLHA